MDRWTTETTTCHNSAGFQPVELKTKAIVKRDHTSHQLLPKNSSLSQTVGWFSTKVRVEKTRAVTECDLIPPLAL